MRELLVYLSAFFLTIALGDGRLAAGEFVWLEGEAPGSANIAPNVKGHWGHNEFLSGDQWIHISIEADKVEKETPVEGVMLRYPFTINKAGPFEVWDRIGYEFVRSPFRWRIDDGDWTAAGPDALTTDLMELTTWNEVAWLKLGERVLKAGAHTFEVNIPRTKDEKGRTARILHASDVVCIHSGKFLPDSKNKPGSDPRDAVDREAEKTLFALPDSRDDGRRVSIPLDGLWQVCRADEQFPGETAAPIRDFPEQPHWKGIKVPGDRNTLRPDLLFAHRLWYRTRIDVPKAYGGQSFRMIFPQNNLNTTVVVNDVFCGFNKNPYAKFSIDVTRGIKPGINEVRVGIKDAWYGYSANPRDPLKLRKRFNIPIDFTHMGFQDLAYPIWNLFQSGILATPEFVVAGAVASSDVFCKTSVSRKELAVEVTLANRSAEDASGEVLCEAIDAQTGAVAHALPSRRFSTNRGEEKVLEVAGRWEDPKLWWPDAPHLYRLRTSVRVGGKTVDVSETPFGFREWTTDGEDFRLNGIVWHGWADTPTAKDKESWLAFYRQSRQKMMRFWGTSWFDLPPDRALDFLDRNGVVVRRSGILDGEAIGYMAVENDPALKALAGGSEVKMDLMKNWRDQVVAQVKGERNHPSVMNWSIENEWLYINCINLYGGLMDQFEAEVKKTSEAVLAADPTRPTMTDGGGANKDQSMPIHGNHYVFDPNSSRYPDLAYRKNPEGGGRGRWTWDRKRPRFIGEDYYASGINPADYARLGGEATFLGKTQALPAAGLIYRMLTEGYRWAGYGAWHFWMTQDSAVDQYGSNAPRAVFCRQWDWTFGSGQEVTRTFGIFNDTRFDDPIQFTWALRVGEKEVAGQTSEHRIPAGLNEKFDVTIAMPKVGARREGELALVLSVKGKEVFRGVKAVSVLPPPEIAPGSVGGGLAAKELLVYDPKGSVATFLEERSVPCTALTGLEELPEEGKVLIVGKDALDPIVSTSSRLAAFASGGRAVIVLEQEHPLRYQGLPAAMETSTAEGRTAFGEDMNHPALRGLKPKDFFTWGPDEVVYRNAYVKPTRGGKSLVQCDVRLQNTALVEVPAGKGLILLSQLAIGEKLATNAVARQLLANLVDYGARYRPEDRRTTVALRDNPQLPAILDAIGLEYAKVDDPLRAIGEPGFKIAIVAASPANLKRLAENPAELDRFTRAGGYLVLHGLSPEGLVEYNRIVGFDHMIRPFRRERVSFPSVKNPLTSGLSTGDIVMLSGERMFGYNADEFVASDVFSFVVDFDEIAPFAKFPSDYFHNMVNGFVSADGWRYIFSFELGRGDKPRWTMTFPKEQELVEFVWVGNAFYHPVTRLEMTFDGREGDGVSFETRPNNEPQTFAIAPTRKAREIAFRIADWEKVQGKADVVGVDNIFLKASRPPGFYERVRPLLNVGAMMEYPRGPGGIVLCNLLFKDSEAVPVNLSKKRTILATLLRNLKAPFSGAASVIAGSSLEYHPLDLSKQANQYRDAKGWFGDKAFTFAALPTGKESFAGVPFQVYDFPTSPVPTVIMLDGPNVPNHPAPEVRGIPVERKADALFFLQAARIDQRRNDQEIKENRSFELAHYVVRYVDGKTLEIPVESEVDVDDYHQRTPALLRGAQVAWTRPYPGTEFTAVAYLKQWNNPRPDVAIKGLDLVTGDSKRGVLALIAVTAGSARPGK